MRTFKNELPDAFRKTFSPLGHRADINNAVHVDGKVNRAYRANCLNCELVLHVELYMDENTSIVVHARVMTKGGIYVWQPGRGVRGFECSKLISLL